MYLEHFGLQEFPFSLAPDPRYLYLSGQHREALAHLLYGVMSEGGFVQVTGEVGTGKTTVCRCFLERLPEGTEAAVILNPRLSPEELVASVCDEFRVPAGTEAGGGTVKASLDRLNAYLLDVHARGRRAVLVIDEAQNLTPAALEAVRLLTNLETSRHKLLQIVLVGQPELRAALSLPELRQLAQRITARFHLGPLSQADTAAYVSHRLEVAGCREPVFPREVTWLLRHLSGGVPRLINIVADRALLGAYVQGLRRVNAATLRRAAREVRGGAGWRLPRLHPAILAAGGAALLALAILGLAGKDAPVAPPPPAAVSPSLPAAAPAAPGIPPASPPLSPPPEVSAELPVEGHPSPAAAPPSPPAATPAAAASAPQPTSPPATGPPAPLPEPAPAPPAVALPVAPDEIPAAPPTPGVHETSIEPAPAVASPAPQPAEAPAAAAAHRKDASPAPAAPEAGPTPPQEVVPLAPSVLEPLLRLPEARREQEAWRRLFELWGAAWSPGEGEDPCALAGRSGLACLRGKGGWDGILSRGRPAMVRLHDEEGPAWLAVEGYRDGQVVVAVGSAQRVVDVAALAGQAVDGYVVLWKPGSGAAPGKADVVHP